MTPPAVLAQIPRAVQFKIVREVLASAHPRLALPSIASNHRLTLEDVQAVAREYGYPDRNRMRAQLAAREQVPDDDAPPPDASALTYGLREVRVEDLHPDPDNVRDSLGGREECEELAESIAEVGLLQPIVARHADEHGRRLLVVAGHRRLLAVKMLGWETVETIVRAPMRPDDVVAAMLVENSHRRDLDPIEEARGLLRLQTQLAAESGNPVSQTQLGRKVGRNQMYVSNRLALLDLDPAGQEELRGGLITLSAAIAKARHTGGRVRPGAKGKKSAQHLSAHHDLASRAQARCTAARHKGKGSASVGGVACGECWETVIRADERRTLLERSAATGTCPTCDSPTGDPAPAEVAAG